MAFPPPTDGHVEAQIGETLDDYLVPKKSAIHTLLADSDLMIKRISKGDALTIELGHNPHNGCIGLITMKARRSWRCCTGTGGDGMPRP